jgi:hypothetical protein
MNRRWGHAQEPRKILLRCVFSAALATVLACGLSVPPLNAQSSTPPPLRDWQVAAGGHMEFDVASVKQNTTAPSQQTVHSNIPLGPQETFTPTGGVASAEVGQH